MSGCSSRSRSASRRGRLRRLLLSSVWSALVARRGSRPADVSSSATRFAVSVVAMGVMFAFFDGLSFPISAGMFFLVMGLCGSLAHIGASDARLNSLGRPALDTPPLPRRTGVPLTPARRPAIRDHGPDASEPG